MKTTIFSLLLTLMLGTAFGQTSIEFPFNPDSDGDGQIGSDDLLIMLSAFGEPWTLPDPNLWATDVMLNLISLDAELDSLQSELTAQQTQLDSLTSEALCAYEVDTEICLAGGGSSSFSEWHYYLGGQNCRTVLYYRDPSNSRPLVMHLPKENNCEGEEVHFVGTGSEYYQGQPIRIEHWVNDSWVVLASMGNGADGYALGESHNRLRFVKARFEDGIWQWVQNAAITVPFNQPD